MRLGSGTGPLKLLIQLYKMSPGTACAIRAALILHKKCVREGYELGDAAHNPHDVLEENPARNNAPKELTNSPSCVGNDTFVHMD